MKKFSLLLMVGVMVSALAVVVLPSRTNAAFVPDSPCGTRYTRIVASSYGLVTYRNNYYINYFCSVRYKSPQGGEAVQMGVSHSYYSRGKRTTQSDNGQFKYYAGPVTTYLNPGQCMDVEGYQMIVPNAIASVSNYRVCN